jgi:hypothetical protein
MADPQQPWEIVYQYVVDDVKRFDMQDIIKRRIQRALIKLHGMEFFAKDQVEESLVFPNGTANVQQIDLTLYPGFRCPSYIRLYQPNSTGVLTPDATGLDISGTTQNGDFTEKSVTKMVDGYGYDIDRVYYFSGATINLRSVSAFDTIFWGYIINPSTEPIETCTDWMLINYPDLIACEIKQKLFRDIGKLEEAKAAASEYAEAKMAILTTEKTVTLLK